ncbi:MAG: hypothetical protein IPL07_21940 [Acidimicrobiaceae bacterium]|nr:hypothetical protein [Acidimicrobiaceae bacterium]
MPSEPAPEHRGEHHTAGSDEQREHGNRTDGAHDGQLPSPWLSASGDGDDGLGEAEDREATDDEEGA